MTKVLLDGRRLPHQDWEGDDFTPGAGGKYVTCTDTAVAVDLAFATNGRKVVDGKTIRANVHPHDPDGITLQQARVAVIAVSGLDLIIPGDWEWADVYRHLKVRRAGLVMQGWYGAIDRSYRYQAAANFGHAVMGSHYSTTSGVRIWDALDANLTHHGQWVPVKYIRGFMEELARREGIFPRLFCAYIPLQHL